MCLIIDIFIYIFIHLYLNYLSMLYWERERERASKSKSKSKREGERGEKPNDDDGAWEHLCTEICVEIWCTRRAPKNCRQRRAAPLIKLPRRAGPAARRQRRCCCSRQHDAILPCIIWALLILLLSYIHPSIHNSAWNACQICLIWL